MPTNAEYHADHSRLGASMLKVFVGSPRDYYEQFVAPEKRIEPPTPAMVLGSAVDCLVFEHEQFEKQFTWRPEGLDGRKDKAGYAKYQESLLTKRELTPAAIEKAYGMAGAVTSEPWVAEILQDPAVCRQHHAVWEDHETGLTCKLKLDLYLPRPDQDTDLILDLKSSDDPTPEAWMRSGMFAPIPKFLYDLQLAHYEEGIFRTTGRHCSVGLIVVGSSAPHDVYGYDLVDWLEIGREKRRHALAGVLACHTSGVWRRPEQDAILRPQPSQYDYLSRNP